MRAEVVTLTNMCMIYNDKGQVLVQDRVDAKWGGLTFPGGHVEKGESFVDSVIREVYEETGLTIRSPRICGTKDWEREDGSRYLVLLYKTDQFSGNLRASEEGDVRWMTLEEMKHGNLAEDMLDLLKVFTEDDVSEFHYVRENGEWTYVLK
ncbi:DNA mismatch repair protein MutT [Lachnoclostridium sp. An169]|uniref:8-oxo-dGTP diphosphatase n=1 Tax=Lachnoclostridium sp. An169 TaxID=1965569 RepID=UPI000B36E035|nr:8-oxo-dGTP diphosphatase [Lachnoclostridium sp. An169]OUP84668.1 DNA mismatch repair protein MutT [Lachnoclostridium sp. An169]